LGGVIIVDHPSWSILGDEKSSGVVLTVDFPTTGRVQASFRELVPLVASEQEFWESTPPQRDALPGMTGADYADRWAQDAIDSTREIRAVLGYCVGSVFAAEVAERIAAHQGSAPRVILFDPETPTTYGLLNDFSNGITGMQLFLTPEEAEAYIREGHAYQQAHADEYATFSSGIKEIFNRAAGHLAERLGVDEYLQDELKETFASFVNYLSAAHELDPRAAWGSALAIGSDQPSGGSRYVGSLVSFDVPHIDLLRTGDVAAKVRELVG
jgi:hypothetical protein